MIWFYSVGDRAREAVMYASAYSVLRDPTDGWPDARCSNYNANPSDDLDAPFPTFTPTDTWIVDKSAWDPTLDPDDPASWTLAVQPQSWTQQLPRAYMSPQPSPYLFTRSSLSDRYLSYRRNMLCELASPELYQMLDSQWLGDHTISVKGALVPEPVCGADGSASRQNFLSADWALDRADHMGFVDARTGVKGTDTLGFAASRGRVDYQRWRGGQRNTS